jgi:cell division protein ZapD
MPHHPSAAERTAPETATAPLIFEQPLNERMRTFLRLDYLYNQALYHNEKASQWGSRAAMSSLIDILAITTRSDVRSEVLKEIERHVAQLGGFEDRPGVDIGRLRALVNNLVRLRTALGAAGAAYLQPLRDSEFLAAIKHRSAIPGGTCEFDLPAYFAWQHRPAEDRQADILKWARPLTSLRMGTSIVLRLLRESGQSGKVIATGGSYQQMLSGRSYQLMQVYLDDSLLAFIPEMSANKYMLWVRFTQQDGDMRPRSVDADIPFLLKLCNF